MLKILVAAAAYKLDSIEAVVRTGQTQSHQQHSTIPNLDSIASAAFRLRLERSISFSRLILLGRIHQADIQQTGSRKLPLPILTRRNARIPLEHADKGIDALVAKPHRNIIDL